MDCSARISHASGAPHVVFTSMQHRIAPIKYFIIPDPNNPNDQMAFGVSGRLCARAEFILQNKLRATRRVKKRSSRMRDLNHDDNSARRAA
jgi:hypothetical protein